MCAWEERFC